MVDTAPIQPDQSTASIDGIEALAVPDSFIGAAEQNNRSRERNEGPTAFNATHPFLCLPTDILLSVVDWVDVPLGADLLSMSLVSRRLHDLAGKGLQWHQTKYPYYDTTCPAGQERTDLVNRWIEATSSKTVPGITPITQVWILSCPDEFRMDWSTRQLVRSGTEGPSINILPTAHIPASLKKRPQSIHLHYQDWEKVVIPADHLDGFSIRYLFLSTASTWIGTGRQPVSGADRARAIETVHICDETDGWEGDNILAGFIRTDGPLRLSRLQRAMSQHPDDLTACLAGVSQLLLESATKDTKQMIRLLLFPKGNSITPGLLKDCTGRIQARLGSSGQLDETEVTTAMTRLEVQAMSAKDDGSEYGEALLRTERIRRRKAKDRMAERLKRDGQAVSLTFQL